MDKKWKKENVLRQMDKLFLKWGRSKVGIIALYFVEDKAGIDFQSSGSSCEKKYK